MQPIYRQSQYRNTAVHQPGRAPQVTLPTPDTRHLTEVAAAMVDHADALESTLIDDIEYSSSLAQQNRINDIVTHAQNEYTRRDNIPDGEPDSWYNKDSTFREQEFKTWENSILSQLSATPSKAFIRPESRQKALQAELETRQKLHTQFTAHLATSIPRHARKNFDTNLQTLTDQGNFQAATQLVTSAPTSVVGEQEKLALLHDLQQKDFILSAQTYAASGDPEAFLNYYTSIINQADRPTRLQLQKILNTIQPPAPKAGVTRKKDGTLTYEEEYPRLPFGVPDYIYDSYTAAGGQPAFKADPAIRQAAHKRLTRFAAESVNPDSPESVNRFMMVAELHGYDKSEADAILEPLRKMHQDANEYNPRQTSQHLVNWRNFANKVERTTIHSIERRLADISSSLDSLEPDSKEYSAVKLNLERENARLAKLRDTIEAREKEAETNALAAYLSWRKTNRTASKAECITAYYDFLDDYTSVEYSHLYPYKQEIQEATEAVKQLDSMRTLYGAELAADELAANIQATDTRRQQQTAAPYTMECSSAWSTTLPDSNKEPIIYLPADSTETRTTIPVRNGKTSIPARVVKTDKVETAMLSNHLQMQLGILGASGYNTILFADGQASLTHTPHADTFGKEIINLEARRDKDGNITRYKLPAEDGGGKYEFAGINQKNHPKAYARINKLFNEGKHEEAEQAISDYIISYTQPASDYLATKGIKSTAAEYMLRDIYFNHGPDGFSNVMRRAFPVQNLADFATTHNEKDILQRIYRARADYYAAIIRSKPHKAKFRKGWMNRNEKVFSTALSFIK